MLVISEFARENVPHKQIIIGRWERGVRGWFGEYYSLDSLGLIFFEERGRYHIPPQLKLSAHKRRDGRVGRRRSPAKRVYWETGIEGSNPSLSATKLLDALLISAQIVRISTAIFLSLSFLNACQESTEVPPRTRVPNTSHLSVKEKQVVVPAEVAQRWKSVKLAVIDKTRGTENIYVIPIGSQLTIPSSSLVITVVAFLPSFTMEGTTITSSSNELANPGAKVRIYEQGTPVFQGWIFSRFPNTHAVTHPKYGFSLIGVVPVGK